MARSVSFPEGDFQLRRVPDGAFVEMAAIVAAELNQAGKWQWCILSPPTKELIGDLMFDVGRVDRDVWYYLAIE